LIGKRVPNGGLKIFGLEISAGGWEPPRRARPLDADADASFLTWKARGIGSDGGAVGLVIIVIERKE
jgi:hypothetical protein